MNFYKLLELETSCMTPKEEERYSSQFLCLLKKEWNLSPSQLERIQLRATFDYSSFCSYINSSGIKCTNPVQLEDKPVSTPSCYCLLHNRYPKKTKTKTKLQKLNK